MSDAPRSLPLPCIKSQIFRPKCVHGFVSINLPLLCAEGQPLSLRVTYLPPHSFPNATPLLDPITVHSWILVSVASSFVSLGGVTCARRAGAGSGTTGTFHIIIDLEVNYAA